MEDYLPLKKAAALEGIKYGALKQRCRRQHIILQVILAAGTYGEGN